MSRSSKVFALIPAAGLSTRLPGGTPKILAPFGKASLLEHSLEVFVRSARIAEIVVLAQEAMLVQLEKLLLPIEKMTVAAGGESRQASVRAGLAHVSQGAHVQPEDLILIHDAARPLLSAELLNRCIDAALEHKAVSAALPVVDTLKRANADKCVAESVSRDGLWAMQTPQVFQLSLLQEAHRAGGNDATDDVSLVQNVHPVHLVLGDPMNLKITYAHDLEWARSLLSHSMR